MALTGKTIGELTLLQFPTNDTAIPVEYVGDTYHIVFSSITYNEGTYSQFVAEADNGVLTPGRWYLMTDFQTCYDQPNYDNLKDPIFTDNYMTGDFEPILLLAMSTTGFSPTVYSTLYPQDKITYDITWDVTEVSEGPAKGRITERIDNFNNRTDYDHRSILFKRYDGYSYDESNPLSGLVGISGITGTTAVLYGDTGTTFNSTFSTGSILAIDNLNPKFFEIISVESNSLAIISGVTINETSNSFYYSANDDGVMSYYQPNIKQNQVFESTTFGTTAAINNYVGNYANLYVWNENPFILANNVFISGSFINNTIGNNSYNNTFNDDCDGNQIGPGFYNNSTNDDFDGNIIGDNFNNNYITSNFTNNRIGNDFDNNILLGGDFNRNNIGNDFRDNVLDNGDFQNNEIGNQFNDNKIYDEFYNNDIGNGYNGNDTYRQFYRNLIGNGFNNNNIYSDFYENEIGHVFNSNTISTFADRGDYDFSGNRIGSDFNNNTLYWDIQKNIIGSGFEGNTIGGVDNLGGVFESNQIMNIFKGNNIQGDFTNNQIKTNFKANEIGSVFSYNNVGYNFFVNTLSGDTTNNTIGDDFEFNNTYGSFQYNTIGTNFYSNEVQDGFGFGGETYQGNRIGNNFYDNIIGEYFYNNTIPDNFTNNIIGDYFQWNIVETYVNGVDFTTYYGNISGITYTSTGTTLLLGTYIGVGGTASGFGINATFTVDVSGGTVNGVTVIDEGILYSVGDTITILGSQIGGVVGQITTFTINGFGSITGTTGTYPDILAQGGSGAGAYFNVIVTDGLVDAVTLDAPFGSDYLVGDVLTLPGDSFGSTEDMTITVDSIYSDNIVITVTSVSETPPVYETFTCNIFERQGGVKRLSYYDDSDTLIITTLNND